MVWLSAASAHCWIMFSFSSSSTPKSSSAVLLSISSSPSLCWYQGLCQPRCIALDFLKPHEILMGPLLKIVQVPVVFIVDLGFVEKREKRKRNLPKFFAVVNFNPRACFYIVSQRTLSCNSNYCKIWIIWKVIRYIYYILNVYV